MVIVRIIWENVFKALFTMSVIIKTLKNIELKVQIQLDKYLLSAH